MRVLGEDFVSERSFCEDYGIAVFLGGLLATGICTPAVADDENHRFLGHADRCNGSPGDEQRGIRKASVMELETGNSVTCSSLIP